MLCGIPLLLPSPFHVLCDQLDLQARSLKESEFENLVEWTLGSLFVLGLAWFGLVLFHLVYICLLWKCGKTKMNKDYEKDKAKWPHFSLVTLALSPSPTSSCCQHSTPRLLSGHCWIFLSEGNKRARVGTFSSIVALSNPHYFVPTKFPIRYLIFIFFSSAAVQDYIYYRTMSPEATADRP